MERRVPGGTPLTGGGPPTVVGGVREGGVPDTGGGPPPGRAPIKPPEDDEEGGGPDTAGAGICIEGEELEAGTGETTVEAAAVVLKEVVIGVSLKLTLRSVPGVAEGFTEEPRSGVGSGA